MTGRATPLPTKGHLSGGLFLIVAAATLALSGCGPGPGSSVSAGPMPRPPRAHDPLATYRELGYIVGRADFEVVGRFVHLPGPRDSTFTLLALSFPNTSLRFRRDPPGFLARYRVTTVVRDSAGAEVGRLDEIGVVRVHTFRETSRTDESVVFQGYLKLPPGSYRAEVTVNDLGAARGLTAETDLVVPSFQADWITAPILVHRAEGRTSRDSLPDLIVSPRATVPLRDPDPRVYVEGRADSLGLSVLEADVPGEGPVWSDTVALGTAYDSLAWALTSIELESLPPGALELRARLPSGAAAASGPLLVVLTPDWIFEDYGEVVSFLRYAGTPAEVDSLRRAPPELRAQRLLAFWKSKDPVPATARNEYFEQYFRRIEEANDRFAEPGRAGWLSDRGEVYVSLGPPDELFRPLEQDAVAGRSQVWRYDRSLGFEIRLVFIDETGAGAFRLTPESRRAFSEAVQRLHF
jgi:GWxTD domain-containing protein